MRSRGDAGTSVLTAESMADRYGVVKGTYASVALPRIQAHTACPFLLGCIRYVAGVGAVTQSVSTRQAMMCRSGLVRAPMHQQLTAAAAVCA